MSGNAPIQPLLPFEGVVPQVAGDVFIAPGARVIGDVVIGAASSVWYNCVVRGDVMPIRIGMRSNIQDGSILHVTPERFACTIGNDILIGHLCIVHGCILEDRSFVGMAATIMDGCVMEEESMLAAGALLTPGKRIRARQLWAGRPAKFMRELSDADLAANREYTNHYTELRQRHLDSLANAS